MKDWDVKTIVLGYDGSCGAEKAAQIAATMARQNEARLIVVSVFPEPEVGGKGEMEGRVNRAIPAAEALAQDMAFRLKESGVEAQAETWEGHAPEALLRAADAHHADVIVIGRRGHSLVADLLLGSTSEHVVRRAKVPVVVAH